MSLRGKSMRALGLSLLLTVIAAGGFVAADLARGESDGSSTTLRAPASGAAPAGIRREGYAAPSAWLGKSGRLRAVIDTPESVRQLFTADLASATGRVAGPGLHDLGITTPKGDPFYVLALLPYEAKEGSTLRGYRVGHWPAKGTSRYAPPAGFIEVTQENEATQVSEQFRLKDFLTHDQVSVWPKYLVLKPRLLDKLELISAALAERGLPSKLHVMSGFRTPQYNKQGVGRGGRASMSRHMYGDAADVFVDEDGNGSMDDLNRDGRITVADAQVLFTVAEGVEAANPDLVGGLSPYRANSAHGPFVHVDTRGTKARW